ncbi:MAG: GNAT family N-acetyltransferase [Planctomycetes bacterium]|nr:GNAT family N-acetyltransferase [Planctomycetota bacterium]
MSPWRANQHRPLSAPPAIPTAGPGQARSADFELRPFNADQAAEVAGWVETPADLFILAPATPPPLTAEKVCAWTSERDTPLLLWPMRGPAPAGYAELNVMAHDPHNLWIGHLIVPRPLRRQGIGYIFIQHLMRRAFVENRAHSINLVVFPENEIAVNCYLKCGWRKDSTHYKTFDHRPGKFKMSKMKITERQFQRFSLTRQRPEF